MGFRAGKMNYTHRAVRASLNTQQVLIVVGVVIMWKIYSSHAHIFLCKGFLPTFLLFHLFPIHIVKVMFALSENIRKHRC